VTGGMRAFWFCVHLAGIVLGIWAGVQFFHWAL
jgi:hypothetical protein